MLKLLENEIADFFQALESESEVQHSRRMSSLETMVPHADISAIIFYGAKERTTLEMAQEALRREEIWRSGGRVAVRKHIRRLMNEALEDPESTIAHQLSAKAILKSIAREERKEQGVSDD